MRDLTREEEAELVFVLRRVIDGSRYPLSRKTQMHREILRKPTGRPKPEPLKPIKPALGKK
jgi:hypothetical protein